jgi:hypothetical protein
MTYPTPCRDGVHTLELADREVVAERLLRTSRRHSFDPDTDVDWDTPCDPDLWYMPETAVSLYDTPLWGRLSHRQRVELSKRELARIASIGIWSEMALMHILVSHAYRHRYDSLHTAYALTEVADECRHSIMFGRGIRKAGLTPTRPSMIEFQLGKVAPAVYDPMPMFAGTLLVEEYTDALQRVAMADERIQPWVRQINRIHVIEEARHVKYAREELKRHAVRALPARLHLVGAGLALFARRLTDWVVQPGAYAAVGLDPGTAVRVARTSPHRRAVNQYLYRRLTAFYREVGLLDGIGGRAWRRVGLVAEGEPVARWDIEGK